MLTIFHPDVDRAPSKLVLHAQQILSRQGAFAGMQQRKKIRNTMIVAVRVQRLDSAFRPIQDPVLAVTLEVSEEGARIISAEPVVSPYISLELTTSSGEVLRPTLKVLCCRRSEPYFDVAGAIVHQLDESC
ncbi:MAG: hypothetical protein ACI9G1_001334 [Pirellulaceae bacterium]|jgi:hypothetical protein